MSDFEDSDFKNKVKQSLDANVQNLDSETRQALSAARRKALNQPPKKYGLMDWLKKEYWLPAGSLALCSLLVMLVLVNPKPQLPPVNVAINPVVQLNDQVAALELLDNADDIDTVTDPDFYLWMDETLTAEAKDHAA